MLKLWITTLALLTACQSESPTNGSPSTTGDPFAITQADATSDLPASARAIFENAETFEILSTKTMRAGSASDLSDTQVLGYPILGRTTVDTPQRQHEILGQVYAAFRENDSVAAGCFNPRHAIVATRGDQRVIAILCFECMQWKGIGPDGQFSGLMGKTPLAAVNAIWKANGLPLAD